MRNLTYAKFIKTTIKTGAKMPTKILEKARETALEKSP